MKCDQRAVPTYVRRWCEHLRPAHRLFVVGKALHQLARIHFLEVPLATAAEHHFKAKIYTRLLWQGWAESTPAGPIAQWNSSGTRMSPGSGLAPLSPSYIAFLGPAPAPCPSPDDTSPQYANKTPLVRLHSKYSMHHALRPI